MRKTIYSLTIALTVLIFTFTSLGGPGGADDPLVSVEYLEKIFMSPFKIMLEDKDNDAIADSKDFVDESIEVIDNAAASSVNEEELVKTAVRKAVADKVKSELLSTATNVNLLAGEKVTARTGTKMVITSGEAMLFGVKGDAINLTRGGLANVGTKAPLNTHYFFAADNTSGFEATVDNTNILVFGQYKKTALYEPVNTKYAQALYDLGLFRGTNDGFDLHKKGDRLQGLIMLIRLMGYEDEALAHSGQTQFTDLTGWFEGHKYIGYGYENGITKGTNTENTTFSPSMELDEKMYYTFVLRALGYDDGAGDFHWEKTSESKAVELGLITKAEQAEIAENGLYRDYIVKISYNALKAKIKGTNQTLAQKLISDGVFTQNTYNQVVQNVLAN
ncbi:MAG: hypothetical protein E7432_08680 [Ruminococcaceae bacterium]|nr:hypothetical protein [Oscillospiraceae bacterium]